MTQDILITPGSGEPQILFRGSGTNDTPIELNVLSSYQSATGSGTALVFEGQEGQLFAVTDNLSSGTIFSVGDITGLSMLSVDASGDVKLGEFANSVIVYPGLTLDDNVPSTTSNVLYNDGGDLMWNGVTVIQSGAAQAVDGSGTASYVARFTDTNTLGTGVIYDNGTNVGIGTASPSQKLHIDEGNIRIEKTTDPTLEFNDGSANRASMWYDTSEETFVLNHADASLNQLVLTSGNDVGVGTNAPNASLHVYSAVSGDSVFNVEGTNGSLFGVTDNLSGVLMSVNTIAGLPVLEVNSDYSLTAGRFNQNDFAISSSGNVGIGTASPSQKLHVAGNLRLTGAFYDSNNAAGTSGQVLSSTATGTDWISLSEIQGVDGTGSAGQVSFWSDTDTITGESNLYWDSANNRLGINTSNPSSPYSLHVNGYALIRANTQPTLKIDAINTSSPSYTANIELNGYGGRGQGIFFKDKNYANEEWFMGMPYIGYFDKFQIGYDSAGGQSEYEANSFFTINSAGNVGIGTASPSEKLHVYGTAVGDGALIGNAKIGVWEDNVDFAAFTHNDIHSTGTSYALLHRNNGNTYLNAASSAKVHLRINNADAIIVDTDKSVKMFGDSTNTTWTDASPTLAIKRASSSPYISFHADTGGRLGYLQFNSSNVNRLNVETYNDLIISTNDLERMTVSKDGYVNFSNYLRIDHDNDQRGIVFEDDGGTDTIYMTVNDGQGNFNIMLGVNHDGNRIVTGDGLSKILMTGHGVNGQISLNAGQTGTGGASAVYNIGLSIDSNDQKLRIGNPSDNVGLDNQAGNIIADVDGDLITRYLRARDANGIQIGDDSDTLGIFVKDGGNVGIDTTSPSSKLTIGTTIGTGSNINSTSGYNFGIHHSKLRITSAEDTSVNPNYPLINLLVSRPANWFGGTASIDFETRDRGNNVNRGVMARILGGNAPGTNASSPDGGYLSLDVAASGSTTPSSRMAITRDGYVGIGTTNPVMPIHLHYNGGANSSQIQFTDTTTGATSTRGLRVGWNGTAGQVYLFENANLRFATNNSERMTISSGGNVGIGTTSPSEKLHVAGDVLIDGDGTTIGGGSWDNGWLKIGTSSDGISIDTNEIYSVNDLYLGSLDTSKSIIFRHGTVERMRVASGGNVGIGTASPVAKLDVDGQVRIDSVSAVPTNCKLLVGDVLSSASTVPVQIGGALRLKSGVLIHDDTTVGDQFYLRHVSADGLRIYRNSGSGSQNILLAEAGGDVGIGTTSPQQKLHVVGDQRIENATDPKLEFHDGAAVGGYVKFDTSEDNLILSHFDVAGDNQIALANDGNVGIGTASPNAVLHAYGSTPSGTVFNVEGTNGSLFSVVDNLSGVLMSVNNNAGLPVFEVNDDDSIIAGRFAQDDFVITSSGDIGMGTANPSSKLEVNGTVTATCASLGQLNVDNLRLDGNTLSSTNTNGNINITPNGTGGIAAGTSATVTGSYAVVGGGRNNTASGNCSTVGGGTNNCVGNVYSTIGGGWSNNVTGGCATVAGGRANNVLVNLGFVGGGYSNYVSAGSYGVIVGGLSNVVSQSYGSIGGGRSNCATAVYSTASGGCANTASANYSTVGGGRSNCSAGNHSTVGGGFGNTACFTNSSVSGGCNNFVNARHGSINGGHYNVIQSPTNECCSRGATIGGGVGHNTTGGAVDGTTGDITGTVTCCDAGRFSTIGGGFRNIATGVSSIVGGGYVNTASGSYSIVSGGFLNSASGNYSTVGGGFLNCASGSFSTISGGRDNFSECYGTVSGGRSNCASGNYSTVGGGYLNCATGTESTVSGGSGNCATANFSTVSGGYRAKATRYGEVAHAAGQFAQKGDAQHSTFVARKNTTDATANVELFLDGSSQRMTLTAETTWTFDIKLSAYNDTDNTTAWWIIRGGIRRNAANVTTLIGSLIEERDYEGTMSGTSAAVTADDTNESLKIAVTGLASKNIRWVAVVDVAQVSWGTP